MNILACDPGLTSGLASLHISDHIKYFKDFSSWECDFEILCGDLYLRRDTNMELVIEKFTITNETAKKSRQYDALNIIGVFRYCSYMSDWPLTLQSPGSAKKLGTDDRLKDLGWYTPGKGHANDAARHLLLYCVNNAIITFVDDRPVFIC